MHYYIFGLEAWEYLEKSKENITQEAVRTFRFGILSVLNRTCWKFRLLNNITNTIEKHFTRINIINILFNYFNPLFPIINNSIL